MKKMNQTNSKQIVPPRLSGSETRKPWSQVIDGALEEEKSRRRAVSGFEIPVTRARIRSSSKTHRHCCAHHDDSGSRRSPEK